MSIVDIGLLEKEIWLAKRYLEQVDSNITLTHSKNALENIKYPRLSKTQTWRSSILPTKTTKTTRGMLYRSQLSNISKSPVHLPVLPQIHYQQFCHRKAVHSGDGEIIFEGLIVERANKAPPPTVQLNHQKILPPINPALKVKGKNPRCDRRRNGGRLEIHVKWKDSCKCMRCQLMKSDYEVGVDHQYEHWGQYPCVPDAVINREEQDSSDED